MSFDVSTLLDARFPSGFCPQCMAYYPANLLDHTANRLKCSFCDSIWEKDDPGGWHKFFESVACHIEIKDAIAHARNLALLVQHYKSGGRNPAELFFGLLAESKYFVHFASYNFTTEIMGALAMVAKRLPVRGIIGESLDKPSDAYKLDAVKSLSDTCKRLKVQFTGTDSTFAGTHQKVYIFDGIVAISGSANLTLQAWKKAGEKRELIDVCTELDKVRELNNTYISRHFRRVPNIDHFKVVGGCLQGADVIDAFYENPYDLFDEFWFGGT